MKLGLKDSPTRISIFLFIIFLFSCNYKERRKATLETIFTNWEMQTLQAISSCNDTLAVAHSNRMMSLIQHHNLRRRVLDTISQVLDFSDLTYIVEANTGDPNTYKVCFKMSSASSLIVVDFDKFRNKLNITKLETTEKDYSLFDRYFGGWDDYEDSVSQEQRIFDCGEPSLHAETIFRLTFDPQKAER